MRIALISSNLKEAIQKSSDTPPICIIDGIGAPFIVTFKLPRTFLVESIAFVVTVVAILSYDYLPPRKLDMLNHPENLVIAYSDEVEGGKSHATRIDNLHPTIGIDCTLVESDTYEFCGIGFNFDEQSLNGVDLSVYQYIVLTVNVSNTDANAWLFVRNYNPDYVEYVTSDTPMFSFAPLTQQDFNKTIEVNLQEFRVAEWWIDRYHIPRQYGRPEFNNVTAIGIDLTHTSPRGYHKIIIDKFELRGVWIQRESWYLGIMLFWFAYFGGKGSLYIFKLYRDSQHARDTIHKISEERDELQAKKEQYEYKSITDPLTDSLNRFGFEEILEKVLTNSKLNHATFENHPVHTLMMIDIDHFKAINDNHGHDIGDTVLKELAQLIQSCIREQDILCRWGGEEFVLLCPNCKPDNGAVIAEKIRSSIEKLIFQEAQQLRVTTSIGLTRFEMEEDFQTVYKRADEALYTSKQQGRNQVTVA